MTANVHQGPLQVAVPTADLHPGPLQPAAPTHELHPGPLVQTAHPQNAKRTWREKRWQRRRRRRAAEEMLGWILVPIIAVGGYWAVKASLNALGTTPTALVQGVRAAISGGK